MKWAIAGLTCLGIVAAACAALLVSALRAGTIRTARTTDDSQVQVLLAAHPLHEMTVVESEAVISTSVPRSQAPGFISDPVQVVGRILLVPMTGAQTFTMSCFANDDKSAHLASLLPKGKRAVGITVSDYAGLEGVLYPGCAVDVMVSTMTDSEGRARANSRLLLENIPVWGIEKQTIVSSADKIGADADSPKNSNHRRITVLVDTKQAKLLEKGMQEGTLSLALRNPLDNGTEAPDRASDAGAIGDVNAQHPVPTAHADNPWEVIVTRGEQSQTQSFSMPSVEQHDNQSAKRFPDTQPVIRTMFSGNHP